MAGAQDSKPDSGFTEGTRTVVLLGNGLIEEGQGSGYLEARLTRRFSDRPLIFRNLGWTGDTVWARARTSGFQNPSGLERLKKQTAEIKPDLIIVGYGLTESFEGPPGLEKFSEGYGKLLDLLSGITPHFILLSPAPHEDLGRPYPDPAEHNRYLESYGGAIRTIAERRRLPFVDLFHPLVKVKAQSPSVHLSTNGILLSDAGYWLVAYEIERQLGLARPSWRVELGAKGEVRSATGVTVSELKSTADGLAWKAVEEELPPPTVPVAARGLPGVTESPPVLVVSALKEGEWTLRIDDKEIATARADSWASGVALPQGPSVDQEEAMRRSIAKRNNLYTRRWRPINDWPAHYTYIQPDYALYDALVAEQDTLIATQSKPVIRTYHLSEKKP
jgi:lysophospholipase L1-like esterase